MNWKGTTGSHSLIASLSGREGVVEERGKEKKKREKKH
jgi:hypothetical protein